MMDGRPCRLSDVHCTSDQTPQKHRSLTFSVKKNKVVKRRGQPMVAHYGKHCHFQVTSSKPYISELIWVEREAHQAAVDQRL